MKGHRYSIGPDIMRELRRNLPSSSTTRPNVTQTMAAYLLGCSERAVRRWEELGTENAVPGWAYVGAAYRVAGPAAARRMVHVLAQARIEGSDVWGRV